MEHDMDRTQPTREPSTDDIAAAGRQEGAADTPAETTGPDQVGPPQAPAPEAEARAPEAQVRVPEAPVDTPRPDQVAPEAPADLPGRDEAATPAAPAAGEQPGRANGWGDAPLLPEEQGAQLRAQWREVQTRFVDDPREAVAAADRLVAELMQTLASGFAERRRVLEEQWQRGEDVGTEDLRVVLQQYRGFFDRLLSA
jgi:hypothetical protein